MSIPQFTTPTFTLTFNEPDLDLTEAQNVYVTFTSGLYELTKQAPDITVKAQSVEVYLSQEETGNFRYGNIEIQVNWTSPNGERSASGVVTFSISKQLLKKVVE